jgi:heavy metal sensor kinase
MTIKTRLTIWYAGIWVLSMLLLIGMLYFVVKKAIRREMRELLHAEALEVPKSFTLTAASFKVTETHPWEEIEHQVDSDYALYLQIIDAAGHVLHRSDNLLLKNDFLPIMRIAEQNTDHFLETSKNGKTFFLFYHPLREHETAGAFVGWMQVGAYEGRVTTFLQVLSQWLLIGVAGTLGPAVLVGWFMAKKALTPLDQIAAIANTVTGEKLDVRLPIRDSASTEVIHLTESLNNLLRRLEEAFTKISQFTNDAAHELLTPLTSLLSDIDITLRRDRPPQEYAEALKRGKADTQHMVAIFKNLLFLARADRSQLALPMTPLDPAGILEDTLDDLAPLIYAKTLQLEIQATPAEIMGNETLLRQLFANLIKNAITYSNPNGQVTIKAQQDKNQWRCDIADTGVGIPPAMQKKIFERFFRADESRSRDTSGAGLGLPIAREIARHHGGEVELVWSEPGKGAIFMICLPIVKIKKF